MTRKSMNITPEMRDNYAINSLIRKEYDASKDEFRPLLDGDGSPVIIPGVVDLQPRQTYNQNCIVRKISRNEYAYA